MTKIVPLIRWFAPIGKALESSLETLDYHWLGRDRVTKKDWRALDSEYRVIILADAGAGKTFEFRRAAERHAEKKQAAFFIRIEDISAKFTEAFEVGTSEDFSKWLESTNEAWFYLDSVDEVRLDEPRAFEKAIRTFAERIHDARHRAHIYISSRPYAWRPNLDRALIEELLPSPERPDGPIDRHHVRKDPDRDNEGPVRLYRLEPLDEDDIRTFAGHRRIEDINSLIATLEHTALFSFAQHPFDLEDIIATWAEDRSFHSRLKFLQRGIKRRLSPPAVRFGPLQKPALDEALRGARLLAAAAVLTGESNIRMPGAIEAGGVDAATLLSDWSSTEVRDLLSRGVFNEPIYGMVRFRHRETRELLAAEWFAEQLGQADARVDIEGLLFREKYSEAVIVPRLRPILSWLILFNDGVRERALVLDPQLATEGGDASQLPLEVRRRLLHEIVSRIVDKESGETGGDNTSIARIAQSDLACDTLELINRHFNSDKAIFFLARLSWQGNMKEPAERLFVVAVDSNRGIWARIASARAVMTSASFETRQRLWSSLIESPSHLPRRLLAELIDNSPANDETARLVIGAIARLEGWQRFETTGLSLAIHRLVDQMPLFGDRAKSQPLQTLIEGFNYFLSGRGSVESENVQIPAPYRWLLAPALHCAAKLISGRAAVCLGEPILSILNIAGAPRSIDDLDDGKHKQELIVLIPKWPELNDLLFWRAITNRRAELEAQGQRLTSEWQVMLLQPFWGFDEASFERTVEWIGSRETADDRMVALSRTFRTYVENERPKPWLRRLKMAVSGDPQLEEALNQFLHPPKLPDRENWRKVRKSSERRAAARKRTEALQRAKFIAYVIAHPDEISNPPGRAPGELSNAQFNLFRMIEGDDPGLSTTRGAVWRKLIPEFGEVVAEAYREGAMRHWRAYQPGLPSEGAKINSISAALIFAMAGLEIEAGEDGRALASLPEHEARHAMQFIVWELNGFPRWLEPLYRAYPQIGRALITGELFWELEHASADQPWQYILHDLVYHASWLHAELAQPISEWLSSNELKNGETLRYCRHILINGGADEQALAELAKKKIADIDSPATRAYAPDWYALWVDTDPDSAIPAFEEKLGQLDKAAATDFAESFVTALMRGGPSKGAFRTAKHLKHLYHLMHRYICVGDDIDRSGKGVFSPIRRDSAQDGRNALFSMLIEIPGKETHDALLDLARTHAVEEYRPAMRLRAHQRAVSDSDIMPWTNCQMRDFLAKLSQ